MLIFLDTETSGLYPGQIAELAYIMVDGERTEAKNFFFDVDFIEPSASMVNGLTVENLRILSKGNKFKNSALEIANDFKDSIIFAHNLKFDLNFLMAEFSRTDIEFTYKAEFCTMRRLTPILKLPKSNGGYKFPKLIEALSHFKITNQEVLATSQELFKDGKSFHDARVDATAVYMIYEKIKEQIDLDVLV